MKKTICLVTNWYPTKENPYAGLFFKEQAFAVADEFDFVVFRYQEHIRKNPFKKSSISVCNTERNTVEYAVSAYVPISVYVSDILTNFNVKYIQKKSVDGIGRYMSRKRKTFTRNILKKLFNQVDEKVDVFYCVDGQSEAYNLQCLSEMYGKPYVVGEHAPVPWPGSLITDINKNAIEKADLFLAISNDKIRQLLLQNIKLPKTIYIGNLIDESKLVLEKKPEDHVKTFIIVAAHSFYKNYDLFVCVMNRLTEITDKEFKVMIVGYSANRGYSKDIDVFEKKIRNAKFADRAVLVPEVPHERIGEAYNKADVFVMTSIQEGQPVSAMEAACCGLPIFSTRCGGVEDYVDKEIGRIYDINDAEGMAQGLKEYLEGTISFDSEIIRQKIVSKFGNEAFRKTFTDAFNRVIENGRS